MLDRISVCLRYHPYDIYLTENMPINVFFDISKYPQAVMGVREETFLSKCLVLRLSSLTVSVSSLSSSLAFRS